MYGYSGPQNGQPHYNGGNVGGSNGSVYNPYSSQSSSLASSNPGGSGYASSILHSSHTSYQQVHRVQPNQTLSATGTLQPQAGSMQDLRASSSSVSVKAGQPESHKDMYDLRASSSNIPMRASHQALPTQPGSSSGLTTEEDGRAKVEYLQGLVDKQALQLRRRNEELLDLQRNHEAFREKFVLFREGMRSKTDESDGRFRCVMCSQTFSAGPLFRADSSLCSRTSPPLLTHHSPQLPVSAP